MTQLQGIPLRDTAADVSQTVGARLSFGGTILMLAGGLMLLGAVMSISTTTRLDQPFVPENPFRALALRQMAFALAGLLLMWVTYGIGHRFLHWRGSPPGFDDINISDRSMFQPAAILLVLVVIALVAVLLPQFGTIRNGARRWLQFGPSQLGLGFQPSELAKLAVPVFLAAWLTHRRRLMPQFCRGLLPPVIIVGVIAALVVIEDLGTAALIVLVGGMMIIASGARWWHAVLMALPGLAGFAVLVWKTPYRMERVLSFRDIWADPLGTGYHAIQSLVAIASGGWLGCGLGAGTQKYGYLPEAETDFIFSIICEELGIVGGLAIIALFMCFVLCGACIMRNCPDRFGKLLALGITLMIGFQGAINIAVVTVMVPTKGISLPLVSAGGSGIITFSIAVGLLASIDRHRHTSMLRGSSNPS